MTEILGLDQSIAYVRGLADLAGEHVPDGNEGYLSYLATTGLQGAAVDTARQMQEGFAAARAAARRHAAELDKQRGVQHACDQTPDAGDKNYHQTNAGASAAAASAAAPQAASGGTAPAGPAPLSDEEVWQGLFPKLSPEQARERRREVMRDYGIFWCPDWCVQHDEEDQWEQHVGDWTVLRTADEEEISVRPWSSWTTDDGHVEVRVTAATGSDPHAGILLTPAELDDLRDLLDTAQEQCDQDDPDLLTPAYDGAEDDEDGSSDWAQAPSRDRRRAQRRTDLTGMTTVLDTGPTRHGYQ